MKENTISCNFKAGSELELRVVAALGRYGKFSEAAFSPLLPEVARVQLVSVRAGNASLPTDRFAAAH